MSADRPMVDPRQFGELTLRDYLQVLRRQRLVAITVFLAVLGIAVAYSTLAPVVYQSEATVLIRTSQNNSVFPTGGSIDSTFVRTPAAEFAYATSTDFRTHADTVIGTNATVTPSHDDSRNASSLEAQLLTFTARGETPEETRLAAQGWAELYVDRRAEGKVDEINTTIRSLELQIDELEIEKAEILAPLAPIDDLLLGEDDPDVVARLTAQRVTLVQSLDDELLPVRFQLRTLSNDLGKLEIASEMADRDGISARINTAAPLGRKVAPQLLRNLALGATLGLFLGLGAALINDSLRTRIRNRDDISLMAHPPVVLAELPMLPDPAASDSERRRQTAVYGAEMDRIVSAVAYQAAHFAEPLRLLVTSPQVSEGKSTLVQRVSRRLGDSHLETLVLDGDLRRPVLHQRFDVATRGAGFAELLQSGGSIDPHTRPVPGAPRVRLLPAGRPTDDAASLLRRSFEPAIDGITRHHEIVIVDSPPVLAVNDAEIMANSVDKVVVVIRANRTTRAELQRTLDRLHATRAEVLGIVLVGVEHDDTSYGYGYGYELRDDSRASSATRQRRPEPGRSGGRSHRRARSRSTFRVEFVDAEPIGDLDINHPTSRRPGATPRASTNQRHATDAATPHSPLDLRPSPDRPTTPTIDLGQPPSASTAVDLLDPDALTSAPDLVVQLGANTDEVAVVTVATAEKLDDLAPGIPTWLGDAPTSSPTDDPTTPADASPVRATPSPSSAPIAGHLPRAERPTVVPIRPRAVSPQPENSPDPASAPHSATAPEPTLTPEQRRTLVRRSWTRRADTFGFDEDLSVLLDRIRDPRTGMPVRRPKPRHRD